MLEFIIALLVLIAIFVWPTLAVILVSVFILYNVVKFIANIYEYPTAKMVLFTTVVNLVPAILGIWLLIWAAT